MAVHLNATELDVPPVMAKDYINDLLEELAGLAGKSGLREKEALIRLAKRADQRTN